MSTSDTISVTHLVQHLVELETRVRLIGLQQLSAHPQAALSAEEQAVLPQLAKLQNTVQCERALALQAEVGGIACESGCWALRSIPVQC
jgi:hypothetical protein